MIFAMALMEERVIVILSQINLRLGAGLRVPHPYSDTVGSPDV